MIQYWRGTTIGGTCWRWSGRWIGQQDNLSPILIDGNWSTCLLFHHQQVPSLHCKNHRLRWSSEFSLELGMGEDWSRCLCGFENFNRWCITNFSFSCGHEIYVFMCRGVDLDLFKSAKHYWIDFWIVLWIIKITTIIIGHEMNSSPTQNVAIFENTLEIWSEEKLSSLLCSSSPA